MFFRKKKEETDPRSLMVRREYRAAISLYRKLLDKEPKDSSLRLGFADALLADKQIDLASGEYKKAAEIYSAEGFFLKAIAIYKKILKLRPGDREIETLLTNLTERKTLEAKEESQPPVPRVASPFLEIESVLFRDFSAEELRLIIGKFSVRHYEEDTIVVQEGNPGDSMFIVVHGEVRVLTKDAKEQNVVLANLGEGEFFGEGSLLTGKPRTATIVTNTICELLELTRHDYQNIVSKYPNVKKVLEDFHLQRAYKTVDALVQSFRENA